MGGQVKATRTVIGTPGAPHEFVAALDSILRENLPDDMNTEPVRIRLIAHASLAVGWWTDPQRCWCYNWLGVKLGSWSGDWYTMDAPEFIDGKWTVLKADKWRAFAGWSEAVTDTANRLRAQSDALEAALDPSEAADRRYAEARKKHGYWTAPGSSGVEALVSRCKRVRKYLAEGGAQDGYVPMHLVVALVVGVVILSIALAVSL